MGLPQDSPRAGALPCRVGERPCGGGRFAAPGQDLPPGAQCRGTLDGQPERLRLGEGPARDPLGLRRVPGGEGGAHEQFEISGAQRGLEPGEVPVAARPHEHLAHPVRVHGERQGVAEQGPGLGGPPPLGGPHRGRCLLGGGRRLGVAQGPGVEEDDGPHRPAEADEFGTAQGAGDGERLLGQVERGTDPAGEEVDVRRAEQQLREREGPSGAPGHPDAAGGVALGLPVLLQEDLGPAEAHQ